MKSISLAAVTALLVVTLNASFASDEGVNPLLGAWKSDREKILSDLHDKENSPKEVIQCFESRICGSHIVEFMEEEYWTVIVDNDGNQISREKAPYKILDREADFIVIDQMENGGVSKIFLVEGGFYIEGTELGYRDYHKRFDDGGQGHSK